MRLKRKCERLKQPLHKASVVSEEKTGREETLGFRAGNSHWKSKTAEGYLTFETSRPTWVSVQDVVLNTLKDRPRTQPSQPIPELSHFCHTTQRRCLAHVAMVLVDMSLLDTKQMRSRLLTSFCQLHKSDQKHMSSQKVFTSRHGLFVQISLSV